MTGFDLPMNYIEDTKALIKRTKAKFKHYQLLTVAQRQKSIAIGPIWLQMVDVATKSRSLPMVAKSHVAIRYCNR